MGSSGCSACREPGGAAGTCIAKEKRSRVLNRKREGGWGGGEEKKGKKSEKEKRRVCAWHGQQICLFPLKKFLFCSRWEMKSLLPGATADRERSQRREARKQLPALPLQTQNNNNNRRVKKGKVSERGLRAPGRVGSPRPAPSPGPRHLIPLLAAGPPPKGTGGRGGGSGRPGALRGGGGGPFIRLSPRRYHAAPHPPTRPSEQPCSPGLGKEKGEREKERGVGEGGGKVALRSLPGAGTHGAGSGAVPGVLAPLLHGAEREAPGVRGKEQCCLSVPALISE